MSKKHTHKYHRVLVSGVKVFACGFADCNHHMPKHYEGLLIGKASYCWKCGNRMLLDKDNMRYDFPWCLECRLFDGVQGSNNIEEVIFEKVISVTGSELDDKHDIKDDRINIKPENDKPIKVISQHDLNDLFK